MRNTHLHNAKMKVLILGYGAREHALACKIAKSIWVDQIFVAPGNAGTAQIATNVPINDEDIDQLVDFALDNQIDLTVVGTNEPLELGVVDAFQAAGLAIFGPTQAAARLETSKPFAKQFMQRHNIPTPTYAVFDEYPLAVAYIDSLPPNCEVVVKVCGLGEMGRGVSVCTHIDEAKAALHRYMIDGWVGEAGNAVIIEERLHGSELSVFALSDGETAVPLMAVRDHKRIFDHDQGPNTGGIGAYGPPFDNDDFVAHVMETVIQPTIDAMAAEGNPYIGVLYAGMMITEHGYQVIEFNCRFGNPEALVIMTLLESDLVELMLACIEGRLSPEQVRFRDGSAATIMLTSAGYPSEHFPTGLPISGVRAAEIMKGVSVFHHGVALEDNELVTSRGRVLAVTAYGENLPAALRRAYNGVDVISFEGAHYRTDIGKRQAETIDTFSNLVLGDVHLKRDVMVSDGLNPAATSIVSHP